jgi:hypothetical protein
VKGIPHLAQERIEADRFFYDIGSERPNVVFLLMQEEDISRAEDDRGCSDGTSMAQCVKDAQARVPFFHLDIEQDESGLLLMNKVKGIVGVKAVNGLEALALKKEADEQNVGSIVIYKRNKRGAA